MMERKLMLEVDKKKEATVMKHELYFLSFLYGTIELLIEKGIITEEELKKKVMEDLSLSEEEFNKIKLGGSPSQHK